MTIKNTNSISYSLEFPDFQSESVSLHHSDQNYPTIDQNPLAIQLLKPGSAFAKWIYDTENLIILQNHI